MAVFVFTQSAGKPVVQQLPAKNASCGSLSKTASLARP
jgi:hypothetical protein